MRKSVFSSDHRQAGPSRPGTWPHAVSDTKHHEAGRGKSWLVAGTRRAARATCLPPGSLTTWGPPPVTCLATASGWLPHHKAAPVRTSSPSTWRARLPHLGLAPAQAQKAQPPALSSRANPGLVKRLMLMTRGGGSGSGIGEVVRAGPAWQCTAA